MKTIKVSAAIITDGKKVFATQRGYGDFKGGWEFPGGKLEDGENSKDALIREIYEELLVTVEVYDLFCTVEYDYPAFHLSMDCFICSVKSGEIVLKEHTQAKYLKKDELDSVAWLPADICIIEKLKSYLKD